MKVHQLIAALKDMDQDLDVQFAYRFGDHWRTVVAAKVSEVDEGLVSYSEYHQMDQVEDSDERQDDLDVRKAVIIR